MTGGPGGGGIPDKLYFKIGEVCELTGVKSHTLRYWEAEFALLRPQRAVSKQRLYRRVDVENILLIKKFIQEDGLTMAGVKKQLAKLKTAGKSRGVAEEVAEEVAAIPEPEVEVVKPSGPPEQGLLFAVLAPKPPPPEATRAEAGDPLPGERHLYRQLKKELQVLEKILKP